jgi:hypothetical protein
MWSIVEVGGTGRDRIAVESSEPAEPTRVIVEPGATSPAPRLLGSP